MATALKLKNDIKKLKAAIDSKKTPANFVPKLKSQLEKAENELAAMKKGGKPRKVSTTKSTATSLQKLKKLVNKKGSKFSSYRGSGVDLEKDAGEGAMAIGRRESKGLKANQYGSKKDNKGKVYYEYRVNRLDVKQPKKKQTYPKLEAGGELSKSDFLAKTVVYDNGGKSFDRYTVFTPDGSVFGMSENAKGFNQYVGESDEIQKGSHLGKKLKSVPKDIEWAVMGRMEYEAGGYMAKGGKTKDEPKVIRGFSDDEAYEYSKGGRLYKDWNGNKQIDQYGIHDLSKMYDNNFDLIADVHDYFIELKHEINENYANEMKNQLIEVLKSGKFKFNDGATETFKKGGTLGKVASKTHRYDK